MTATLFIFSALNAATFLLLGLAYGNSIYSQIFALTYPIQFMSNIFLSFFCVGSNIRANKENNKNCVESGILLGLIFSFVVFGLLAIFIDNYIGFMNFDVSIFKTFALMSIGQLFFGFAIDMISEKMYFENKNKNANICKLGFIILNLVTVILTVLITKNQIVILCVNLTSLFLYCLVYFIINFKKFKFCFSIIKNFKYESLHMTDQMLMLIIFLFGLTIAFDFGAEYIIALNLVNLITDPAWDSLGSINKIAKIDISQSTYNYKKAFKNSMFIILGNIIITIVLFFSLFSVYKVNLTIGLIYLSIEIICMLITVFKSNLQTYFQLQFSPTICTSINLFQKIVRAILSTTIINPYNLSVGLLVGCAIGTASFLFIRFKFYKVDNSGFLIKKKAIKLET